MNVQLLEKEAQDCESLAGMKVLLAESDESSRRSDKEMLTEAGLMVDTVENGYLVVDAVLEKRVDYYDFILMDPHMPVMNGYEAVRVLKQLFPKAELPIIAFSEHASDRDAGKSVAAGMSAHMAKPMDMGKLAETVMNLKCK